MIMKQIQRKSGSIANILFERIGKRKTLETHFIGQEGGSGVFTGARPS
jgi:hypothetical protein